MFCSILKRSSTCPYKLASPILSRITNFHTSSSIFIQKSSQIRKQLPKNNLKLPEPPSSNNLHITDHPPDITKIVKPITPNDSYVSCTVFDLKGNVTAVSKHFPKMKFLQEHGLYPRDLRKIDTSQIDIIPSIVIRDNCILVNLLHIKALVEADKVMIFDTSNPSAALRLGLFVYDLESKLKAPSTGWIQQYEHRALESILINVMTCLETELHHHLNVCGLILAELEDEIDRDKLRDLLIKSKALTTFYQKALLIRNVLDELLENDDDLSGMYLTEKLESTKVKEPGTPIPETRTDYGEVEMLLEAYYKQCDEFVQQSESLINDIKSTEEIVNIILDANRNSLMVFELKVTIYTLGFTVATLLPAFYGMNLKNFIEESNLGFGGVVGISIIIALIVTSANFKTLRQVQKLTLMAPSTKAGAKASVAPRISRPYVPRTHNAKPSFLQRLKQFRRKRIVGDQKQRDVVWKWLIEDKNK
ncbi:Mitochondrial inner membrane magnesium transporter mrs2 [Wickerhamomyces ciferrii]|uniref:Magnesium transporter n=1 Tax=Wickerhamomyces ciferrii (strain ATCC 14091 / BCRC 22168 / CBS 111 / JCM 3599 / NBRC 0793 / NRRL Y-1031 F-60-10) TaxID=1206466 RepID=K0KTE7_WICCF|nr:Mitochondrial inner membrane magnesium transporter mrs2 [Wickerhamomyces ciferrii]CCH45282.1 Mitochondrial inner membrane magnesium transporter mrs2 [Wickerhamomyces ciferrii]